MADYGLRDRIAALIAGASIAPLSIENAGRVADVILRLVDKDAPCALCGGREELHDKKAIADGHLHPFTPDTGAL